MENKDTKNAFVRQVAEPEIQYGFTTDVHTDIIEKGLNEDIVRLSLLAGDKPYDVVSHFLYDVSTSV